MKATPNPLKLGFKHASSLFSIPTLSFSLQLKLFTGFRWCQTGLSFRKWGYKRLKTGTGPKPWLDNILSFLLVLPSPIILLVWVSWISKWKNLDSWTFQTRFLLYWSIFRCLEIDLKKRFHHWLPISQRKNYFTSSDPHHDIQFLPSDNLSGVSIWHSIWHVFWRFIWHIYLLTFYLLYLLTFCLYIFWHSVISSDILSVISSDILSVISSDILSGISFGGWGPAANTGRGWSWLRSGSEHWAWMVVVEVRQRTLGVDGRGWGPAANTGRGWSWLRSGSEHWAWLVVVEVRQRTLGVAGRGWGPAANTGRGWSWLRSEAEEAKRRRRKRRRRRRGSWHKI